MDGRFCILYCLALCDRIQSAKEAMEQQRKRPRDNTMSTANTVGVDALKNEKIGVAGSESTIAALGKIVEESFKKVQEVQSTCNRLTGKRLGGSSTLHRGGCAGIHI